MFFFLFSKKKKKNLLSRVLTQLAMKMVADASPAVCVFSFFEKIFCSRAARPKRAKTKKFVVCRLGRLFRLHAVIFKNEKRKRQFFRCSCSLNHI
jgi:hypothetical protein